MSPSDSARLLPWTSAAGKPCFLSGDGRGYLSRLADNVEAVQLGMAGELMAHIADLLTDRNPTAEQLRFALARANEALRDVHRVAESRGARLPVPDSDLDEDEPDGGGGAVL
ncbi:hypothetical protein ACFQVC_18900 [Streptomyces monticola]|uniref:Uncharacterized protein n=1 Tax=Streptomyces monticola TaxID=2666263 RepID=A0ABW2JLD6_9ACTN